MDEELTAQKIVNVLRKAGYVNGVVVRQNSEKTYEFDVTHFDQNAGVREISKMNDTYAFWINLSPLRVHVEYCYNVDGFLTHLFIRPSC